MLSLVTGTHWTAMEYLIKDFCFFVKYTWNIQQKCHRLGSRIFCEIRKIINLTELDFWTTMELS